MKKINKVYLLETTVTITMLLFAVSSIAQQKATTEDGKKVTLNADGTWKYVKENSISAAEFDFRNVKWGMTLMQVKGLQKEKLISTQSELVAYETSVIGLSAWMVFYFVDNKLYGATYIFSPEDFLKDGNDYLNDFRSVNNLLEEKYGKPIAEEEIWADDKKKYADASHHLVMGDVSYTASWKSDRTEITSFVGRQDGKVKHRVDYLSLELGKLARKKDKSDF